MNDSTTTQDTATQTSLKTYNVKVPNRKLAQVAFLISFLIITPLTFIVPVLALTPIGSSLSKSVIGLTVIATVTIQYVCHRKYFRDFVIVRQGRVVRRFTTGGGLTKLKWCVELEGYTYANELCTDRHAIDAGRWKELKVGDIIEIESK